MSDKLRSNLVLFGIAALITLADQASKAWIRQTLQPYESAMPIAWLEPYVTFTHVQNQGAAFGLGQGFGTFFVFTAFVAVVLIVFFFRRLAVQSVLLRLALGLQLGGALGNLIDRLRLGAVTDFVNLRWFPVFNVADSSITIGSILLAIFALFIDRPTEKDTTPQADSGATGAQD